MFKLLPRRRFRDIQTVVPISALLAVAALTLAPAAKAHGFAPIIRVSASWKGVIGNPLTFTVGAAETNHTASTYTFSLVGAPSGMSINSQTGVVSWTPAATGYYPFKVTVTDKAGASATKSLSVYVYSNAAATANISIADISATRRSAKTVAVTYTLVNAGSGPATAVTLTSATLGSFHAPRFRERRLSGGSRQSFTILFTDSKGIPSGNQTFTASGTYTSQGKPHTFTGNATLSIP